MARSSSGVSVEIRGTEDLRLLGDRLAAAADGRELSRDLRRNIRSATKPAIAGAKVNLGTRLPRRGGLGAYFARTSIGTRTLLSGRSVGVRIVATKKGNDIAGLDQGIVRHPLFGNRRHWYSQRVPVHLISGPLADSKPEVQRGVLAAMDNVTNRIA